MSYNQKRLYRVLKQRLGDSINEMKDQDATIRVTRDVLANGEPLINIVAFGKTAMQVQEALEFSGGEPTGEKGEGSLLRPSMVRGRQEAIEHALQVAAGFAAAKGTLTAEDAEWMAAANRTCLAALGASLEKLDELLAKRFPSGEQQLEAEANQFVEELRDGGRNVNVGLSIGSISSIEVTEGPTDA